MPLTWHQIPRGGSNPGAQPGGRVEDEIGDDAVTDDTTLVIEVVDETIEGDNALLQSRLDVTPFGGLHDAGDDVEWKDALRAGLLPVHVEGDPHVEQGQLGRLLTAPQLAIREAVDTSRAAPERGVPELAKSSS